MNIEYFCLFLESLSFGIFAALLLENLPKIKEIIKKPKMLIKTLIYAVPAAIAVPLSSALLSSTALMSPIVFWAVFGASGVVLLAARHLPRLKLLAGDKNLTYPRAIASSIVNMLSFIPGVYYLTPSVTINHIIGFKHSDSHRMLSIGAMLCAFSLSIKNFASTVNRNFIFANPWIFAINIFIFLFIFRFNRKKIKIPVEATDNIGLLKMLTSCIILVIILITSI